MLPNAITFFNAKGGMGKSTMNTGHATMSAKAGWQVLLVDLDGQGSAGRLLGVKKSEHDDNGLSLRDSIAMQGRIPPNIVKSVRPNLDMIVGGSQTAEIPELMLSARSHDPKAATNLIESVLAPFAADYDLIVFDLAPATGGVLHESVFAALHYVIYTVAPNQLSIDGLEDAWRLVTNAVEGPNPDLQVLGLCVPMWQSNAKKKGGELNEFLDDLSEKMGGHFNLIEPVVPRSDTAGADIVKAKMAPVELVSVIKDQKKAYFKWLEETKKAAKKKGLDVKKVRAEWSTPKPEIYCESILRIADAHKRIAIEVNTRFRSAQGEYAAALRESA